MLKFHIDDDETAEQVTERVKNYKVVKLLEKYVRVYNLKKQNEG